MVASRVGTQHIAVTRCSRRYVCRSTPSRLPPLGFGTRHAPTAHGTQISSNEKSKAMVRPW